MENSETKTVFVAHPVTAEQKAQLRAQYAGHIIVDAKFAPDPLPENCVLHTEGRSEPAAKVDVQPQTTSDTEAAPADDLVGVKSHKAIDEIAQREAIDLSGIEGFKEKVNAVRKARMENI